MRGLATTQATDDDDDWVIVGDPIIDIVTARPLEKRLIEVTWETGKTDIVDIMPALVTRRLFDRVRLEDDLFATLKVNEYGNAIEWDDGAELTAMWIQRLVFFAFSNQDFRDAMDKIGISLDAMATALQISRRQVANYRKDKPIPRHIGLATRYLVDHPLI